MRVTKVAGCIIREATAKDVELVLSFIKRLAQYEKLEDQVTVTLGTLYDSLFVKKAAKAIIAELQLSLIHISNRPCAMAPSASMP